MKETIQLFLIGVFVTGFLWFFEPFGISTFKGNSLYLASLFGLATFLGGMCYFLVTTYIVGIRQDAPSWKFWKWLIYIAVLIVVIALFNFLVIWFLSDQTLPMTPLIFWSFVSKTFAIGIFPIALSGLISIYRNEKRFQKEAHALPLVRYAFGLDEEEKAHPHDEITIPSRYDESFSLKADEIYFIEAEDNYVAVNYKANGQLKSELIRNSLSQVASSLPPDLFYRCHRSFVVNLSKISDVQGNAQGLVLSFEGLDATVPVSRAYVSELRRFVG